MLTTLAKPGKITVAKMANEAMGTVVVSTVVTFAVETIVARATMKAPKVMVVDQGKMVKTANADDAIIHAFDAIDHAMPIATIR